MLVAEVQRRLANIHEEVEMEENVDIINKFEERMMRSGFGREERRRIISDGVTGYARRMKKNEEEGRPRHRNARQGIHQRKIGKMKAKASWFRNKQEDR